MYLQAIGTKAVLVTCLLLKNLSIANGLTVAEPFSQQISSTGDNNGILSDSISTESTDLLNSLSTQLQMYFNGHDFWEIIVSGAAIAISIAIVIALIVFTSWINGLDSETDEDNSSTYGVSSSAYGTNGHGRRRHLLSNPLNKLTSKAWKAIDLFENI